MNGITSKDYRLIFDDHSKEGTDALSHILLCITIVFNLHFVSLNITITLYLKIIAHFQSFPNIIRKKNVFLAETFNL